MKDGQMEFASIARRGSIYGVVLGLSMCVYSAVMWLTRLDTTYLRYGQYLDMAVILVPITVISLAIRRENSLRRVTLLQRIAIAIIVGAASTIIYDPFLWVYHHVINPDWFNGVLQLREAQLKGLGTPANEIAVQLQTMRDSATARAPLFHPSAVVASVLVIPILIALLSLLYIRPGKTR
jgi:hypothetical protein